MYPCCYECPMYRQFCEDNYYRSPAPFFPPPGGPFGPQPGGPFGPQPGGPFGPQPGGLAAPGSAPTAPPPTFKPSKTQGKKLTKAPGGVATLVGGGSLTPCLYKLTYLWFTDGTETWMYPIYIDNTTIAGYYWTGFNWAYTGIDLFNVDTFICNPTGP